MATAQGRRGAEKETTYHDGAVPLPGRRCAVEARSKQRHDDAATSEGLRQSPRLLLRSAEDSPADTPARS